MQEIADLLDGLTIKTRNLQHPSHTTTRSSAERAKKFREVEKSTRTQQNLDRKQSNLLIKALNGKLLNNFSGDETKNNNIF